MNGAAGFEGVIGPTGGSRRRGGRPNRSRRRARRTCCSSCSTTSGSRSSAATAPTSRRPTFDGLAADGVRLTNFHTTALCSPTRSCLLTGRNHHSQRHGPRRRPRGRLPRLLRAASRARTASSPRSSRAHGYATYAVGKWHLTPEDETHMAAPRESGRSVAASTVGTGSTAARRTSSCRRCTTTTTRVAAAARRSRTATTSAPISPTARSSSSATCARSTPTNRSSATSRPARATRRTTRRRNGSSATAGSFDGGWDAWRDATFARQLAMGLLPARHAAVAAAALGAGVGRRSRPRTSAVAARFMECFAAYLVVHRRADRPRARVPRRRSATSTTRSIDRWSPTTARAPRAARSGSINDGRLWNGAPAGRRELRARIDEIGGPTAHNNYPWGWTMAGNTPFKRWKREVHEGGVADPCIVHWPNGIGARAAGSAASSRTRSTCCRPCSSSSASTPPDAIDGVAQSPIDGTSFAYAARRRRRAGARTTRSTSRCSAAAASTTTAGRR